MAYWMSSDNRVGRLVGVLLLLHMAGGLILPYVLLNAAIGPSGFLAEAASRSTTLRTVVVLFILAAALVLTVAVAAGPVLRAHAPRLADALLAVAAAAPSRANED